MSGDEAVTTSSLPRETKTVKKLATAAYPSFALLAGLQLDVFTPIKDGPMSIKQIAEAIGVKSRRLEPLLYALVAAELLTVEDDLFYNTDEANHFLVPSSPSYMGDQVFINPLLMWWGFSAALKTAESIRTGIPQDKFDASVMSEDELERAFRGTHSVALRAGRELVARYDFSPYRTLVDVGGGSGGLAISINEICPHIKATVVDLEKIVPITRRFIEEAGVPDRILVKAADVVRDPPRGSFDVAVLRAFIQVLPTHHARRALKNVQKSLNPGGVVYVLGHILDDSKTSPLEEVWYRMFSVSGYDVPVPHTEQEHREWLTEAGFDQITRDTLLNGDGVMKARKPA